MSSELQNSEEGQIENVEDEAKEGEIGEVFDINQQDDQSSTMNSHRSDESTTSKKNHNQALSGEHQEKEQESEIIANSETSLPIKTAHNARLLEPLQHLSDSTDVSATATAADFLSALSTSRSRDSVLSPTNLPPPSSHGIIYSDRLDSPSNDIQSPNVTPFHSKPTSKSQSRSRQGPRENPSSSTINPRVNYGPVWKPGFQNRRNQSNILRTSFPAGFQLKTTKDRVFYQFYQDYLEEGGVNPSPTARKLPRRPLFSFHDWTKGNFDDSGDEYDAHPDGDPYGDVAGPLLKDLQRARISMTVTSQSQVAAEATDPSCQVSKAPIFTQDQVMSQAKTRLKAADSPKKVFHAPRTLPALPVAASLTRPYQSQKDSQELPPWRPTSPSASRTLYSLQSSLGTNNTSSTALISSYEDWLQVKRSNHAKKIWKQKGNDVSFNYSAYSFTGEDPAAAWKIYPSSFEFLPSPLPSTLFLEVYTIDQLTNFSSLDQQQQITTVESSSNTNTNTAAASSNSNNTTSKKKKKKREDFQEVVCTFIPAISCENTLEEVQQLIIQEMVKQLEQTFLPPLPALSSHIDKVNHRYHQRENEQYLFQHLDRSRLQILLYHYDYALHEWSLIRNEIQWIETKHYHHHYHLQQMYRYKQRLLLQQQQPQQQQPVQDDRATSSHHPPPHHHSSSTVSVNAHPSSNPASRMETPAANLPSAVAPLPEPDLDHLAIKVMYAFDEASEVYLREQLQQNYERRKQMLERDRMNLSLQDLTEALEKDQRRKRKKYLPVNPHHQQQQSSLTASISTPQLSSLGLNAPPTAAVKAELSGCLLMLDPAITPSSSAIINRTKKASAASRQTKNLTRFAQTLPLSPVSQFTDTFSTHSLPKQTPTSTASGQLFSAGPSILYPKQSPALQKLKEDAQKSIPKLQSFAEQLQDRLLKTKF